MNNLRLLIRSQFYNFLMLMAILFVGFLGIPFVWHRKDNAYKVIRLFIRLNRFLLKSICDIECVVLGAPPAEPCVVCAKHMSFLDVLMFFDALPQAKFIMKAELQHYPIIGFYAKAIGSPAVKRGEGRKAIEKILHDLNQEKSAIGQIVIYPQGTRVLPKEKRPYKVGAFAIYENYDLPCYLAATNVGVLWARGSLYRYPGRAVIEFIGDPIKAGMARGDFMLRIEEEIEEASDRLMEAYPARL